LYLVPQAEVRALRGSFSFFFFEKCAILINHGIVNRCMLGRFFEQISLPAAELELAATSAATLSTSTTMKVLLYRDLGNVAPEDLAHATVQVRAMRNGGPRG